eukprot:NODE_3272_length_953_cov_6.971239_g2718_i0.p3 GENE.NODE_3272_length_953_cov_6.971239_g2718_i0~~NODE_3272_length_953_cov_6.971239_g2718_i0.p3  ORF type:complete len:140 (+),score=10.76 NODE_3272_length_953_cov_6.971239_g2718_i0:433-852(+)
MIAPVPADRPAPIAPAVSPVKADPTVVVPAIVVPKAAPALARPPMVAPATTSLPVARAAVAIAVAPALAAAPRLSSAPKAARPPAIAGIAANRNAMCDALRGCGGTGGEDVVAATFFPFVVSAVRASRAFVIASHSAGV